MKEKGFLFCLIIIVFTNFYNQLSAQIIIDTALLHNVSNYDMIKSHSQGYLINWIDSGDERNVYYCKVNEQFEVVDSVKITNIAGTYGRTAIDEKAGNIASAWLHWGMNLDIADVVGGAVVNSDGKLSADLFFNYSSDNIESRFSQDLVFLTDTTFLVTWVDYFDEGTTRISCKIINVNKPDSNHFLPDLVLSDLSSSSVILDLCAKLNKNGNSFIISWSGIIEEITKIFYKTFDFNLNLLSSKSEIISDQILDFNSNFNADLIPLESGGFLSLYFKPEETNKYNLYLSEYNAELELTYNEMINDSAIVIKDANMSMNDEGKIIVSWTNIKGNTHNIHGQRFNSNLEKIEGNFIIAESKENFERIFSPITLLNNQQIIISYIYGTEPYSLKLKALDFDSPTVINSEISNHFSEYSLSQNYPNPFNPITTISYLIPADGFVTLRVYDVLGKEVATLVNGQKPSGRYNVQFDGSNLSSGIYFYRISVGDASTSLSDDKAGSAHSYTATKKLILMK